PGVLLGLARCRRDQGQTEEARRLLDELLDQVPAHALGLAERGRLALEAGRPAEAEPFLRRAVARLPSGREGHYTLAPCPEGLGKQDEARQHLDQVRRLDAEQKRLDEVVRQLDRTPRDLALRHEAGVLELRLGREVEGLRWLTGVLHDDAAHQATRDALADYFYRSPLDYVQENADDFLPLLEGLGEEYLRTFRLARAVDCLHRYLQRRPGDAAALLRRAEAWRRLRYFEEAAGDYRRVVEGAPEATDARMHLAELLLQ